MVTQRRGTTTDQVEMVWFWACSKLMAGGMPRPAYQLMVLRSLSGRDVVNQGIKCNISCRRQQIGSK